MRTRLVRLGLLCTLLPAGTLELTRAMRSRDLRIAATNDNTRAAGTLRGGVLSVNLVGERARWYPGPGSDSAPPVVTLLFGEEGRAPSNPGPLLRMPLGTRVELKVRNTLSDTMFFAAACAFPCRRPDTLHVAPGSTGRLAFTPAHAGTFVYWAGPIRNGAFVTTDDDSQFGGVIVVDSGPPAPDRIIVVTTYDRPTVRADSSKSERLIFSFNGKAWPYTERFTYTVGDSIRWRVVDWASGEHPLHLHGFYFRVESRGDGETDHFIPRAEQPLVVTEEIGTASAFATYQMVWSPDRAGNWLFHCHKPVHMSSDRIDDLFDRPHGQVHHDMASNENHALSQMGGLVIGITVRPARGALATSVPRGNVANRMRLLVEKVAQAYGPEETFGYSLHRSDSAETSVMSAPGPVLAVPRGERTEVTVVNRLAAPTAVHWHGIELESYYDGVPGWSGAGSGIASSIAPGDSFVAVFTPPRAGTFIYHTHVDDIHQLSAGLYGPLIVLEPGQKWDPATDHVFAIGQEGADDPGWIVVNGHPAGALIQLKAGVAHRFRFLSMTIDDEADVFIERDSGEVSWTPLAKDAIPVVATNRTPRLARLHIGPGETYDFEFTPERGEYRMRVMSYTNVLLTIKAQ